MDIRIRSVNKTTTTTTSKQSLDPAAAWQQQPPKHTVLQYQHLHLHLHTTYYILHLANWIWIALTEIPKGPKTILISPNSKVVKSKMKAAFYAHRFHSTNTIIYIIYNRRASTLF
jgi:hypothetical protein